MEDYSDLGFRPADSDYNDLGFRPVATTPSTPKSQPAIPSQLTSRLGEGPTDYTKQMLTVPPVAPKPIETRHNQGMGKPPAGAFPPQKTLTEVLTSAPPIITEGVGAALGEATDKLLGEDKGENYINPNSPAKFVKNVGKAIGENVEGLTLNPFNAALVAATGGLGTVATPAAKALQQAIAAGFGVDMLKNAYERIPSYREKWDAGDYAGAIGELTKFGADLGMGVAAGTHAFTEEPAPVVRSTETGLPEPTKRQVREQARMEKQRTDQAVARGEEQYADLGFRPASTPPPKSQAQRRASVAVPETGVPEEQARAEDAREQISQRLTSKPYADLTPEEKTAVDSLVNEGYVGAHPAAKPAEPVASHAPTEAASQASNPVEKLKVEPSTPVEKQEVTSELAAKRNELAQRFADVDYDKLDDVERAEVDRMLSSDHSNVEVPPPAPSKEVIQKASEAVPERAGDIVDGTGKVVPFADIEKLVREKGTVSASLLQRTFRMGYGEAARAIDRLESNGVVGPADGSKPREVIQKPEVPAERAGVESAKPANNISAESKTPIEIPQSKGLTDKERAAEQRLSDKIKDNPDAAVQEYLDLKDSDGNPLNVKNGSVIINTDNAREVSPDYAASNEGRTEFSKAVHEPASWLAKEVYRRELEKPAPPGTDNTVLFTAGGTGAGKSTGIADIKSESGHGPQIVFDTNMNGFKSAKEKVDQALNAGKEVEIQYIHRDIEKAFESMLKRAMRMGRPVPIEAHMETHIGAPKALLELADFYKDDPRVTIRVRDNNGLPREAKETGLETLRNLNYTDDLRGNLERIADQALAEGRITEDKYRAIVGRAPEAREVRQVSVKQPPQPAIGNDRLAESREEARRSGKIAEIPTSEIFADPARFQFKANATGKAGVTDEFKDVRKFDREMAGTIQVWRDPHDGRTYVVNGHHRLEMAQRLGEPTMNVMYIEAPDAQSARLKGALINIAEGRGTSIDAAKVIRDSGHSTKALEDVGLSVRGERAKQGIALANLHPFIFDKVVSGEIPIERGVIIGGIADKADQVTLLKTLEKSKRKLTNSQLEEMVRLTENGPKKTETSGSLFGEEEFTRSLIAEKAEVSDYIRRRLGHEKKLFSAVANEAAARDLGTKGNVIKAAENAAVADQVSKAQMLYDKLSSSAGPISTELDRAAGDLAEGGRANDVKERAYAAVRAELVRQAEALSRGSSERPSSGGEPGDSEAGAGEHNNPNQPKGGAPGYGSGAIDKLVAREAAVKQRISKRIKDASSSVSFGPSLPADLLADYAELGAIKIAKGAVKFAQWSKEMIDDFGEAARPYLGEIWLKAREIDKAQKSTPVVGVNEAPKAEPAAAKPEPKPVEVKPSPAAAKVEPPPKTGGEKLPSRLAQGVEEKAVANKLTMAFNGRPEYEKVSVKEQAAKAADLLSSDPERAMRVAMGEEPPPADVLPESVFTAVEQKAIDTRDIDTLRKLATQSNLSMQATAMGQRIRMLAERNPNSPVAAMQEISSAREARAKKQFGPKAGEQVKNGIKNEIRKVTKRPKGWNDWVESLRCV